MTTEQEFKQAIEMLIKCKATIKSGCRYNIIRADWLYYQCKSYIREYEKVAI